MKLHARGAGNRVRGDAGGDNAQCAVKPAAARLGVEMRSGEHPWRIIPCKGKAGEDVACGVDPQADPMLREPVTDTVPCKPFLRTGRKAMQAARRGGAKPGHCFEKRMESDKIGSDPRRSVLIHGAPSWFSCIPAK